MKDIMKKFMNIGSVLSLLMVGSLLLEWYERISMTKYNPYQSAFRTAKDFGVMWIIIILAFVILSISFVNINEKTKTRIYGILSLVMLIINVIIRFMLIPDNFRATKLGWKAMCILCIIHIIIAIKENKKEVSEIIEKEISKI